MRDIKFLNKFCIINKSSYEIYNLYKRNVYISSYYLNDYFINYLGIEPYTIEYDLSDSKFNWEILTSYFHLINCQLMYYPRNSMRDFYDNYNNNLLSTVEKFDIKTNDPFNPKTNLIKLKKIYLNNYLNRERLYALRYLNKCRKINKYIYSIIF